MPAHLEQQQSTQMLRLPHQAAHQRPQHHQGAQPQRQPQARQMGAGQAQRPEASRAPAAPSALGPGPSFLGSAPVPFVRQPLEQALDSPEGERVQPAGRSCPGLAALCPVQLGLLQVHNHGRGCSLPPGATLCCQGHGAVQHLVTQRLSVTPKKHLAHGHIPACFGPSWQYIGAKSGRLTLMVSSHAVVVGACLMPQEAHAGSKHL